MEKASARSGKASASRDQSNIAVMSFEQALDELENIVTRLERGDVPLAQSISIYERGEALKSHCEHLLQGAEAKAEKIRLNAKGIPQGTENLD